MSPVPESGRRPSAPGEREAGSAVMNKHGGARSRSVPHRNPRTQTARPVYGVRCENRKSAGRTAPPARCGQVFRNTTCSQMAGYPQAPELRVPAGISHGHAEPMSRHDSADHTPTAPAGLPSAPRHWPHIGPRDRPVSARAALRGEPLPPWPRRSPEPPAACPRQRGVLRRHTGVPGPSAHIRHGRSTRFARHLWCADSHRRTDADRPVAAPTCSVADTTGNDPERQSCETEWSTSARSAVRRSLPVRARAHHRGIPATSSARAGGGTVSGRSRPVRTAVPAAAAAGMSAVSQVIGPGNSEPAAAGPGDIERRARRYERRMAHTAGRPTDHECVPVLLGTFESQRATPERRSPAVPPDGAPLPSGTPSRLPPGRRFRRSPVRNPVRRAVPEDHTGTPSRSSRYRSVAIAGRSPRPTALALRPTGDGTAQVHASRKVGDTWFPSAAARIPKGPGRAVDLPAPSARASSGERNPATRMMTAPGHQLATRSVSVRARHRRSVVGYRRWEVLLGAAFTAVLVAFPLGPGATAAAYSGGSVVLEQAFTGDTAAGHRAVGAPVANSLPPGLSSDGGRARTTPISAPAYDEAQHVVLGATTRDLSVSHGEAVLERPTVAADPPALDLTWHGPNSAAVSGEGPTTQAAVAACGGSGSASGSGSACTVVSAVGELLRTLIRLAPKIAPPCPCPHGRR